MQLSVDTLRLRQGQPTRVAAPGIAARGDDIRRSRAGMLCCAGSRGCARQTVRGTVRRRQHTGQMAVTGDIVSIPTIDLGSDDDAGKSHRSDRFGAVPLHISTLGDAPCGIASTLYTKYCLVQFL